MGRGQLAASAFPACKQERSPSFLRRPADTWLLEAPPPFTWGTRWESASPTSSLQSPRAGLMLPGQLPPQYAALLDLLREVFGLDCINVNSLQEAQSRLIYKEPMETPPPPRITTVRPDHPLGHYLAKAGGPFP